MSAYYLIANLTKKQRIDLNRVGNGDIKRRGAEYGQAGRVMAWAMCGPWRGDHVVVLDDHSSWNEYCLAEEKYEDVTAPLVKAFNDGLYEGEWEVTLRESD